MFAEIATMLQEDGISARVIVICLGIDPCAPPAVREGDHVKCGRMKCVLPERSPRGKHYNNLFHPDDGTYGWSRTIKSWGVKREICALASNNHVNGRLRAPTQNNSRIK
jgi:hypothetical protein